MLVQFKFPVEQNIQDELGKNEETSSHYNFETGSMTSILGIAKMGNS